MVAISRLSLSTSLSWCCFSWVMSLPTETVPPSRVFNSFTCSQRPSANCRSKVAPRGPLALASRRSETYAVILFSIVSRGVPGARSRSDRP